MWDVFALLGLMACIWSMAKFLFTVADVPPDGDAFFRASYQRLSLLDSRLDAHPLDTEDVEEHFATANTNLTSELLTHTNRLLQRLAEKQPAVRQFVGDGESAVLTKVLANSCCVIPADAGRIHILQSPKSFYEELRRRISASQRRIVMSALYVGDGPLSKGLMKTLEDKVIEMGDRARQQRGVTVAAGVTPEESPCGSYESLCGDASLVDVHRFSVDVLLDYNRMHDRRNMLTIQKLAELGSRYKRDVDVHVYLFQTPSSLNRFLGPFGRSREMLGVQHTKIFAFDDEDVIMTGANLSDDYFHNRMDRYAVIEGNEQLAAWVAGVVTCLSQLSHRVVFTAEDALGVDVCLQAETFSPECTPNKASSAAFDRQRSVSPSSSSEFVDRAGLQQWQRAELTKQRRRSKTHAKSKLIILPNNCIADPTDDHRRFRDEARSVFSEFARDMYQRSIQRLEFLLSNVGTAECQRTSAVIFPTLQFGRIGVHHDASIVEQLLALVPQTMRMCITSPYLNMYPRFTESILLKSRATFDFITASVKSNGWHGHRGFAGMIPYFYLQLERSYFYLVQSYGCADRIRIREFTEPGMTFHAKGMWLLSAQSEGNITGTTTTSGDGCCESTQALASSDWSSVALAPSLKSVALSNGGASHHISLGTPVMAAYGSTNYGNRSVHKDVEVELFICSWHCPLQNEMRLELQRLLQRSEEVHEERFHTPSDGRFQPVVALIAALGSDYL